MRRGGATRLRLAARRSAAFAPDPTLILILTDWVTYPDDLGMSTTDFKNFAGGVLDDLAELQGQDTNLCIESLTIPEGNLGIVNPTSGEERPYWMAKVQVKVSNL